jgi:hypothetical protein
MEYGTLGTLTLSHEEIETAISRLEQLWTDTFAWARVYMVTYGECPAQNPFQATEPAA